MEIFIGICHEGERGSSSSKNSFFCLEEREKTYVQTALQSKVSSFWRTVNRECVLIPVTNIGQVVFYGAHPLDLPRKFRYRFTLFEEKNNLFYSQNCKDSLLLVSTIYMSRRANYADWKIKRENKAFDVFSQTSFKSAKCPNLLAWKTQTTLLLLYSNIFKF